MNDDTETRDTGGIAESAPPPDAGSPVSDTPLDALLEGMGEGFFAFDAEWRFTAFNRAAEKIFGLDRADLIGRVLWDVSPQTVGGEFERRYRMVMSNRVRQEFEAYSITRPDRYHEIRAFPFKAGIGVAVRDISDRLAVARMLGRRERELARVQRIGGMGGFELDFTTGRALLSAEYVHLHGLPSHTREEEAAQWRERAHPDDRQALACGLDAALAGRETEWKAEYRIVRPSDGAVRWMQLSAEIERDAQGRAVRLFGATLDVTDRHLAEQAARASEERLRGIADSLPLLISYLDRDMVFRFANKAYEAWFGRPLDDIVGRSLAELMDEASFALRRPFVERALAGETVTYEAAFARDGVTHMTEILHVPHRAADGRTLGMYSVVQDVTARKLSERVLAESEERFRTIANSAPVPIWVTRLGGQRDFINRAYEQFLGLPYAQALVFDWRNALHPDDLPRILKEQQAGEGSLKPFVLEARYRRGDGQWRWLRSESQPRWGPGGEHNGFIGVAHDVTEAREAEQALLDINQTLETRIAERTAELSATQALIQTFFNHSSECHAVLIEEAEGRFRYEEANPATLRLYGKTRAEVVGRTVDEVFGAGAADVTAHLVACTRQSAPYRYERAHDGSVIEAIATVAPREPGAPRRLFVSAHDVTERRQLEQKLRQSQKMEAVGQLTGGVAHDFNNLLTLVLGGLEGVARQTRDLPEATAARIDRYREMAQQGAERAATLTSRLLSFSRQQSLAPRTLDANALIAGLTDLMRRTLGEAIVLEHRPARGLWPIYADINQLENALLNLALNSRDAMPEGGRLLIETANVTLDAATLADFGETPGGGDYVTISVSDTGTGMDAATRERAFDPFFTTKEVGRGTGLGLSQVYGFARQSAGFVRIESAPGEGATVRLYLPPTRGAVEAPGAKPTAAEAEGPASGAILLVEDDEALRAYGAQSLRDLGYRVIEAANGASALEPLMADGSIDLLLTDIVMPGGIDGRHLADRARSHRPDLKVLFMTGYAPDDVMRRGQLDAREMLIEKPFSFEALARKVRQALASGA